MQKQEKREAVLEKAKARGLVLGLRNIRSLMAELGDVQDRLSILHIAGTNGKGSVGAMLEAILTEAGIRVGRYSSPAVFFPEEIYRVNQRAISQSELARILDQVSAAVKRMEEKGQPSPTLFEIETAAAFLWFYQQKCQLVLLETGLGGREDATNVIRRPLCSIFTAISRDHMAYLGDTVAQIATEKAGIIKPGCPVVTAEQEPAVFAVLAERCAQLGGKLYHTQNRKPEHVRWKKSGSRPTDDGFKEECGGGQTKDSPQDAAGFLHFDWGGYRDLALSLIGAYQPENAVCALLAVRCLNEQGYRIDEAQIRRGLAHTQWPGRFELVGQEPLMILDGAHNEDAAKKLRQTLEMYFTNRTIIYIIGVLADKDHQAMLRLMLPLAGRVYTVTPDNPRALPGEELCREAQMLHSDVQYMESIAKAVQAAAEDARRAGGLVLAFGSLSWLAAAKEAMAAEDESAR